MRHNARWQVHCWNALGDRAPENAKDYPVQVKLGSKQPNKKSPDHWASVRLWAVRDGNRQGQPPKVYYGIRCSYFPTNNQCFRFTTPLIFQWSILIKNTSETPMDKKLILHDFLLEIYTLQIRGNTCSSITCFDFRITWRQKYLFRNKHI